VAAQLVNNHCCQKTSPQSH